jgi:hypothetical protein
VTIIDVRLAPDFVLVFKVPDILTLNTQYSNVAEYILIRFTIQISLKHSKLGRARYIPISHRKSFIQIANIYLTLEESQK